MKYEDKHLKWEFKVELIKQELRIEHAIEEYKKDKISFGKASELAGLNIWEWIDEVHKRGVQSTFSLEDAREELERWRKSKKNEKIEP